MLDDSFKWRRQRVLSVCLNMHSENFANEYCFCNNNKKGPNFHEFPCF